MLPFGTGGISHEGGADNIFTTQGGISQNLCSRYIQDAVFDIPLFGLISIRLPQGGTVHGVSSVILALRCDQYTRGSQGLVSTGVIFPIYHRFGWGIPSVVSAKSWSSPLRTPCCMSYPHGAIPVSLSTSHFLAMSFLGRPTQCPIVFRKVNIMHLLVAESGSIILLTFICSLFRSDVLTTIVVLHLEILRCPKSSRIDEIF